jgi:hypothetical protein
MCLPGARSSTGSSAAPAAAHLCSQTNVDVNTGESQTEAATESDVIPGTNANELIVSAATVTEEARTDKLRADAVAMKKRNLLTIK